MAEVDITNIDATSSSNSPCSSEPFFDAILTMSSTEDQQQRGKPLLQNSSSAFGPYVAPRSVSARETEESEVVIILSKPCQAWKDGDVAGASDHERLAIKTSSRRAAEPFLSIANDDKSEDKNASLNWGYRRSTAHTGIVDKDTIGESQMSVDRLPREMSRDTPLAYGYGKISTGIFDDLVIGGQGFLAANQITEPQQVISFAYDSMIRLVLAWSRKQGEYHLPVEVCHQIVDSWKSEAARFTNTAGEKPRKEKMSVPSNEHPDMDKPCMPVVPALSKRFINHETGMPVYKFAVRKLNSDDTIYEFQVDTGLSWIPDAGDGAFLTYLGARRLKRDQSIDIQEDEEESFEILDATVVGRSMRLKIVGEGLEDFISNPMTTLPPLYAETVEYHHGNFGFQNDYSLEDYGSDDSILFSSTADGCSRIDLGRYAPFLPTDRKYKSTADLKNFVWSNMPSEYEFELDHNLHVTREQVGDITDDFTGLPHEVAKRNVAKYVNETGGDPALLQTVWGGDAMKRGVDYFFHTQNLGKMRKGQQVELLISYNQSYDDLRLRKGYGMNSGGIKSDKHFPTFLERQFVERYNMTEEIYNEMKSCADIYVLTELLVKIHDYLAPMMESFLLQLRGVRECTNVPSAYQMIALRRLSWLRPILQQKLKTFEARLDMLGNRFIVHQCVDNVSRLDWPLWTELIECLDQNAHLVDRNGLCLRKKLVDEATVEFCYSLNSSLLFPCSEDAYCKVGTSLIRDLCFAIAKREWRRNEACGCDTLQHTFENLASEACRVINDRADPEMFQLSKDCWKRYGLENCEHIKNEPEGTMCVLLQRGETKNRQENEPEIVSMTNVDRDKLLNLHTFWYICRQVIFVVDVFAQRFLSNQQSLSLEKLCVTCGIPTIEKARYYLDQKLCLTGINNTRPFYGPHYDIYKRGNILNDRGRWRKDVPETNPPTKRARSEGKPSINKFVFWKIVWTDLRELGWTMDRGNLPGDWYICPPGVTRGRGSTCGVDYFDSIPLVRQCLETDPRYCYQAVIMLLVGKYKKCEETLRETKAMGKRAPKFASWEELAHFLCNGATAGEIVRNAPSAAALWFCKAQHSAVQHP